MKLEGTIQDRLNKLIGVRFNRLTILGFIEPRINKAGAFVHMAICKCDCHKTKVIGLSGVKSGKTKSCGCALVDHLHNKVHKHGLSRIKGGLYRLLNGIKTRCYDKTHDNYPHYGGKGVIVCDEWLNDFMSFYNWCNANGYKKGLQIDKDIKAKILGVEPNLYSPERCMFVTPKRNSRNRKNNRIIEYDGKRLCISEWSEITGLHKTTILNRLDAGWKGSELFSKPTHRRKYKKVIAD